MPPPNRLRPLIWGSAAGLLLLPLIAMQFTTEVNWTLSDFMVMGVMLFTACAAYELVTRLSGNSVYRAGAGIAIVTGFLTVWVNLAVGMIGSEDNSYNLLFAGVLCIALFGTLIARFRAKGMAQAMNAAGLAQLACALVALFAGWDNRGAVFSALFAAPWFLAGALLRKAAARAFW